MARTYKTEGVVLKRINFGETDKIITLFTKHYGKIKCLAKGIRNLTSRKGGNLELFNQVIIFLAKGKNLDVITEVQLVNAFAGFRKNLVKVALAFQAIELVDRFTGENQENQLLYENLKNFLNGLANDKLDNQKLIFKFKINLLQNTGFGLPAIVAKQTIDEHIEKVIEKRVKCFYE